MIGKYILWIGKQILNCGWVNTKQMMWMGKYMMWTGKQIALLDY